MDKLNAIGINGVVKDETESARLAGFGGGIVPGFQEIHVHKDELDAAVNVVEGVQSEMQV